MGPNDFSRIRNNYLRKNGFDIDKSVFISSNVSFKGNISIKNNTSISENCSFSGGKVGIHIGSNVMIAPSVVVVAFNHNFDNNLIPMINQPTNESKIIIEDNVWICANCTIGKGVTIGQGAIIAANSFVNKSVPKNTIVGGVPAKFLKSR